jgi:hypothetical protein
LTLPGGPPAGSREVAPADGPRPDHQLRLIAADFWSFDPAGEFGLDLDGARWPIEGRRGKVYRGISQWSAQGELHAPGQLFSAPARPPLVERQVVLTPRSGQEEDSLLQPWPSRRFELLPAASSALVIPRWYPTIYRDS